MKLRQSLIAALICLESASGFAMGNPDSPECKYWAQQLISLEERIAKTQDKLEQCEQTSYDCHDL
ncbi:MAG: hypothetical protein ACXVCP_12125, partial [Bdellovibrio sp.]